MARQRRAKRRRARSYMLGTAAALALILLVILLSPWGPFKNVLYGKGGSRGGGPRGPGDLSAQAPPGPYGLPPAHTGPATPASASNPKSAGAAPVKKVSDPTLPTVAIVVDDVANGKEHLDEWLAIDAPLNFAIMPHMQLSGELGEILFQRGYTVMMHIPTTLTGNSYSGPGQLAIGMDRSTVFSTLDGDLATIPHVTGINNHQGSGGCDDYSLMLSECEWAKARGLFVVDSNASYHSEVTAASQALGMGKRRNQVFIDHQNDPAYMRNAMRELAGIARKNGTAIGICHWHRPNTAAVVGEMVNTLRAEGIHFVFVNEITN